jgi:hypothetical protein
MLRGECGSRFRSQSTTIAKWAGNKPRGRSRPVLFYSQGEYSHCAPPSMPLVTFSGPGEDTDSAASTGPGEDTDSAASTGRRECTATTPVQQWWRLDAGPRSVTVTCTLLFVLRSVTRSRVPNSRMRLAAVSLSRWYGVPLAVVPTAYAQKEAFPTITARG